MSSDDEIMLEKWDTVESSHRSQGTREKMFQNYPSRSRSHDSQNSNLRMNFKCMPRYNACNRSAREDRYVEFRRSSGLNMQGETAKYQRELSHGKVSAEPRQEGSIVSYQNAPRNSFSLGWTTGPRPNVGAGESYMNTPRSPGLNKTVKNGREVPNWELNKTTVRVNGIRNETSRYECYNTVRPGAPTPNETVTRQAVGVDYCNNDTDMDVEHLRKIERKHKVGWYEARKCAHKLYQDVEKRTSRHFVQSDQRQWKGMPSHESEDSEDDEAFRQAADNVEREFQGLSRCMNMPDQKTQVEPPEATSRHARATPRPSTHNYFSGRILTAQEAIDDLLETLGPVDEEEEDDGSPYILQAGDTIEFAKKLSESPCSVGRILTIHKSDEQGNDVPVMPQYYLEMDCGVIIDDSYTLRKIFDQSSKQNVRSIRTTLNRFLCVGAASIVSNSVARVYGHVGNAQVSSGYEAFSDSGDAPGNTTTKQTERPPTKFVYVSDSTTSTESTPHKELSEPSQTLISPVKQLKGESCFETAALVHKKNSKRKRLTVNGDVGELLDHCDDDKRLKKQKPALNTPTATYRAQSAYKLEIKQGEAKLATRLPVHRYEDTKPSGGGGG
mmetsp:Transcript_1013/g.2046  ORF Transcript_1013/g.2046 Transcript_1013/m.2046 type:complete len:612 (-) Transcript_1013:47-1882(-)